MKPVSIHPLSALAGAGLLGLMLLAAGAQSQIQVRPWRGLVRVAGIPDPRQMLVVSEDTPFVVPAQKLFVATGLGMSTEGGPVLSLLIDGIPAVVLRMESSSGFPSIRSLPLGLTAPAGATITVCGGGGLSARAWGYLVDA